MDKKKILAVLLFLLMGFFMFTFANPSEKNLDENKNNKTEEKEEVKTIDTIDHSNTDSRSNVVKRNTSVNTTNTNNLVVVTPVVNEVEPLVEDLTSAKASAKKELKEYADELDIKDQDKVKTIIDAGNKAIDNSKSRDEIKSSLDNAKKVLDNLKSDEIAPILALNGDAEMTLEVGRDSYIELYAEANDNKDGKYSVKPSNIVYLLNDTKEEVKKVDSKKVGTYVITYNCIDTDNNKSNEVTRTIKVVDTIAPIITNVVNSTNGEWTNSKVVTSWDIIEKGTGLKDVQYCYSKNCKTWRSVSKSEWYKMSRNKDRNNTVYIRAIDNENNISNIIELVFKIDTKAPAISVKTKSNETIGSFEKNVYSKISFKLSDNISVSKTYLNGVLIQKLSPNMWSDANFITMNTKGAKYGENVFTLEDLAGNKTNYTFIFDYYIEKEAAKKELTDYSTLFDINDDKKNEIVNNGLKSIDNSKSRDEINKSLEDAKKALLEVLKNKLDTDLINYNDDVIYVSDVKTIKNDGIKAINEATTKEEAIDDFNNVIKKIDDLKVYVVIFKEVNKEVSKVRVENGVSYKAITPAVKNKDYATNSNTVLYTNGRYDTPDVVTESKTINATYDLAHVYATVYSLKEGIEQPTNDNLYTGSTSDYIKVIKVELKITDEIKKIIDINKTGVIVKENIENYVLGDMPLYNKDGLDYVWYAFKRENDGFHIDGIIKDITKPVITLSKEFDKTIELGSNYVMPVATATDTHDGKVEVKKEGSIDTNTVGTYTVKYTATDKAGNKSELTKTVEVKDTIAPTITLNGDSRIDLTRNIFNGHEYEEKGVKVTDLSEIVSNTKTIMFNKPYEKVGTKVNRVDTSRVGTYTITYTAIDEYNNKSEKVRTIVVDKFYDSKADILIDTDFDDEKEVGSAIPSITATAFDGVNNKLFNVTDVSNTIVINSSEVNMNKVGTYPITFTATDWAGHKKTVTRNLKVVDKTDPVITFNGTTTTTVNGYNITIPNYTAIDNYDGNITNKVDVKVNTEYDRYWSNWKRYKHEYATSVTYTVIDKNDNKTKITKNISKQEVGPEERWYE